MNKLLLILIVATVSIRVKGQTLNGLVVDSASQSPVANVQVISKTATVLTNELGIFTLSNIAIGDKISFRLMGYATLEVVIKKEMFASNLKIKLSPKIIDLREVRIQTNRNYKNDSLSIRKEYAAVFAYKAPNFTDMFVKVDPSYRSPHANINPYSTASILRLNVISALSFLTKKRQSTTKFKQTLLKDEALNYLDYRFSKTKIQSLTPLKGDSLTRFMRLYQPSYSQIKQMNDYEIMLYIKKSYAEFIKQGN